MPLTPDTDAAAIPAQRLLRVLGMISLQTPSALRACSGHPLGRIANHVALIAVGAAALLLLASTKSLAEEERPPFLTMEDQRRCIVQDDNCFRWIYQKALVGLSSKTELANRQGTVILNP